MSNGVLRNGISARSQSLGGAGLALGGDALSANNANPAGLTDIENDPLIFSLTTAILDAEYRNTLDSDHADSFYGVIPDIAYARALSPRLTAGLSFSQVSAVEVDWKFQDPPSNGTGTTFGEQTHKSSFLVSRAAIGLGYDITPDLSVGASLGLLYNRNRLKAPYIFQSAPGLAGAKVLVNLEADGFGWNGILSANYKATENLELLLAYTSPSHFDATGQTRGFAQGVGNFSFDTKLETELPQILSTGFNYHFDKPLQIGVQLDWIDWSDAFDKLPLQLTNGNSALPRNIDDVAPLNWKDQLVIRVGAEYDWSERVQLRAGYSFGDNPVPSETLTATTAAITRHTITLGLGYKIADYKIDFGYQWDLPTSDAVGTSALLAGEYDNSEVDVSIHWLSLAITFDDLF